MHARQPGVISLAGGLPAASLFPVDRLREIAESVVGDPSILQYGLTEGEVALREWVAERHRTQDDRPWTAESVQIVNGSQQALDLLGKVLLDPGDTVVVAEPEYLGAVGAFRQHGAELVGLPIDAAGLDVEQLDARLEAGLRPKCCYVIPEFHNPTGATHTTERLAALARLAERYGFLIIEDNPYGRLRFEGTPVSSLATMTSHVVQLRTVSKTIAPGLRVGWMVGPPWLLDAVRIAKQSTDLHTSTLGQALVTALVSDPTWYDHHLAALAPHYRERRDALIAAVADLVPEAAFIAPSGGMFLWLTLPQDVDTTELLPLALTHGMAFVPGSAFSVQQPAAASLRLSFATASPQELREGVQRLAAAIASRFRSSSQP